MEVEVVGDITVEVITGVLPLLAEEVITVVLHVKEVTIVVLHVMEAIIVVLHVMEAITGVLPLNVRELITIVL